MHVWSARFRIWRPLCRRKLWYFIRKAARPHRSMFRHLLANQEVFMRRIIGWSCQCHICGLGNSCLQMFDVSALFERAHSPPHKKINCYICRNCLPGADPDHLLAADCPFSNLTGHHVLVVYDANGRGPPNASASRLTTNMENGLEVEVRAITLKSLGYNNDPICCSEQYFLWIMPCLPHTVSVALTWSFISILADSRECIGSLRRFWIKFRCCAMGGARQCDIRRAFGIFWARPAATGGRHPAVGERF